MQATERSEIEIKMRGISRVVQISTKNFYGIRSKRAKRGRMSMLITNTLSDITR